LRTDLGVVERVEPAVRVTGTLAVPGDKSIAHRGFILGALAGGESLISGAPAGEDVAATVGCLRSIGVVIQRRGTQARIIPSTIAGEGLGAGFSTPHGILDCANSGTTMRLLLGLLAGSGVSAALDGDASLRRRPMARIIQPLQRMGARIESDDGRAPLRVIGSRLQGRRHSMPVPSAQVKSALLLAGLSASGPTSILEPVPTRDHTERLLRAMGADLRAIEGGVEIRPFHQPLRPLQLAVPGDFSSAAFFMAAAAMRPGWTVKVEAVGLNPTRTAFLQILETMGAEVSVDGLVEADVEPRGDVMVRGRRLRAAALSAGDVARAIDEIPALFVLATQAEGITVLEGLAELRVKESDRIATMLEGLRLMGARVDEHPDGVSIHGPVQLRGAVVDGHGDHRIAMALAVAALVATGPTDILGADCVAVSYPQFFSELREVTR
jgi:3-phosphoshikimate 1-carboxyvinyltransferase